MSYWACAQLETNRTRLALHCLALRGFTSYAPLIRGKRATPACNGLQALFPGYAFVRIELQWHAARWCAGIIRLVLSGAEPAKEADGVIDELRGREVNGAVVLAPAPGLQGGDRVLVKQGRSSITLGSTMARPHISELRSC
jgi:hypothetical protein